MWNFPKSFSFHCPSTFHQLAHSPGTPYCDKTSKHHWLGPKGYISSYWTHAIFDLKDISEVHFSDNWDTKNVELAITLYRGVWDDRNRHIHGGTKEAAKQRPRKKIQDRVILIYRNPPRLASRYPCMKKSPLQERLNHSTTRLQRWLSWVQHKSIISSRLQSLSLGKQQSIKSFCVPQSKIDNCAKKYPPWHI
jgi:hypothetical protein